MDEEITPEVKHTLIQQEIMMWRGSRYQLQLRHRVHKALGTKDILEQIEKELEMCEKALDVLEIARAELRNGEMTS